jgi:hypothetical protein
MNRHVEDTVLREFLAGAVSEDVAVEVALHIDACPTCTARADALDPFLAALSSLPDPVPPPDLVEAVLVKAEVAPARASWFEIGVGAGLLGVAAVLAAMFGDPVAAASRIGRAVEALSFVGSNIALAGPVSVAILAIATITLAALSQQARTDGPAFERRTP